MNSKQCRRLRLWVMWCGTPVGVLFAAIIAPHVFWFDKLVLGTEIAMLVGGVIGAIIWRRLGPDSTRLMSYKDFSVLVIAFIFIVTHLASATIPDLLSQERELRRIHNLSASTILSITVQSGDRRVRTSNPTHIRSLVGYLNRAILFYPSHEGYANTVTLVLEMNSGAAEKYTGGIPERHGQDIAFDFKGHSGWRHLMLQGGHEWLEAVVK